MRPSELISLLSLAIPTKRNVLIVGAPGVGKTDIVTESCKTLGANLIISHPVVSDPTDYKGFPIYAGGEAKFVPFSDLKQLVEADSLTVFFLDDLGQAPASVQAACFTENVIVSGKEYKRIKDVEIGDKVIDIHGNLSRVNKLRSREYKGVIYNIKAVNHLPISATEEHPFYVISSFKRGNKRWGKDEEVSTPIWKKASKIELGDYIGTPKLNPTLVDKDLLISNKGSTKRIIELNEDFALFLGYYVGNGCYVKHPSIERVEIALNLNHEEKHKEVINLFNGLFDTKVFVSKNEGDNSIKIAIHDPDLGSFLSKYCGENVSNKRIPNFILFHKDINLLKKFLIGYLKTDGNVMNSNGKVRGVVYTTTSKVLALQTQQAFTRFNSLVGIKIIPEGEMAIRDKTYKTKEAYRIQVSSKEALEALDVSYTPKRKVEWFFEHENILWVKVRDIEFDYNYKGLVYNLEVDNTESYVANNYVVHNCMQLLLGRRINGHKVSDYVTFIAATNRRQDLAGVQGILEPVKSRFATIIELTPNVADWIKWALTHEMPAELIAFIRWRESAGESMLYNFKPSKEMTNSSCPRTVANVGYWMNNGLPRELEFETISGAAGEAFAKEFLAFLKIARDLPDPDTIIANPKTASIPDIHRPDIMFALIGALSFRATEKNFGNILTYSERLPIEFNVTLVKDCIFKDRELVKSSAFIDWASKHEDIA